MNTSGLQTSKGFRDKGQVKTQHKQIISLRLSKPLIQHPVVKDTRNGLQNQVICSKTLALVEKLLNIFVGRT